ncbi:OLC1v1035454C2 [Oldenlandia corymbosa var. corymbosa]|uniref:OLC1v1035454C2 n=1 Tax=Oldenlandia corymbosa var. corymbosa TaxID=529605 RepID=A0AAV1CTJ3_OLDCO|nr:OLC1v1035454C2 [Oldenlandia corymbosa var. corymbosa]
MSVFSLSRVDSMWKHYAGAGPRQWQGLKNLVTKAEEKIYTVARSQSDYVEEMHKQASCPFTKMATKMACGRSKYTTSASKTPPDEVAHGMQSERQNQQLQHHQLMDQKCQLQDMAQSQHQNIIQPSQIESSHFGLQPSATESPPSCSLQQNQEPYVHQVTQPVLQHSSQSDLGQSQRQTSISQKTLLQDPQQIQQQQQQVTGQQFDLPMIGQQSTASNLKQNMLIGQSNCILDIQAPAHPSLQIDQQNMMTSSGISSKLNVEEKPIERLIKAVTSTSHKTLTASVDDIRAAVGEDLLFITKCCLRAQNCSPQAGPTEAKRMRHSTSVMSSNANGLVLPELESTRTSGLRKPRIEASHALVDEIHKLNRQLIGTVVEIIDDDVDATDLAAAANSGEGIIVKCSFGGVCSSGNLESRYISAQMPPIQPLWLLIPTDYPNSSPILLDKFHIAVSKVYESLSMKAKSKFSSSLGTLSQPISLTEMVRRWDFYARAAVTEYAQECGGGTFSSKYGTWEKSNFCVTCRS